MRDTLVKYRSPWFTLSNVKRYLDQHCANWSLVPPDHNATLTVYVDDEKVVKVVKLLKQMIPATTGVVVLPYSTVETNDK